MNENALGPVKKDSLSQKIQDRIIEMIRNGTFPNNTKLPSEREFCEKFQVSRTSVREALKGLISIGMLEKRGDGTYVHNNTEDIVKEPLQLLIKTNELSMENVFEARVAIECQIARIAAERAEKEDIILCHQQLELIDNSRTAKETIIHKAKFHMLLAQITRNPLLISMFAILYDVLHEFHSSQTADAANVNPVGHGEILKYIELRDADAAARAMRLHLAYVETKNYRLGSAAEKK